MFIVRHTINLLCFELPPATPTVIHYAYLRVAAERAREQGRRRRRKKKYCTTQTQQTHENIISAKAESKPSSVYQFVTGQKKQRHRLINRTWKSSLLFRTHIPALFFLVGPSIFFGSKFIGLNSFRRVFPLFVFRQFILPFILIFFRSFNTKRKHCCIGHFHDRQKVRRKRQKGDNNFDASEDPQ